MELESSLRERLVFLVAMSPPDGRAITRAMNDAGIATQRCTVGNLSHEVCAGVGALILAQEALSQTLVRKLVTLIEKEPIWSDIPLVILTTSTREASAHWRLIRNAPSVRNATFLERPMRIATLVQAVKVALRGREKQYLLRDQIRAREKLLALSERNEQRLSAVLNNTKMAVFFMDERQHCTFMNTAAENLTGYTLVDIEGRSLLDKLHRTHPDGTPYPMCDRPIDRAFPDNNQTEGEEIFVHKDGHFYPVAFTASPIRQEHIAMGTVLEAHDISERKADAARLHLLMNELNHRVKNTLVTVQSILVQTLKGQTISDQAIDRVMSRVMALSRSHDLLTENSWVSATLGEVVFRALAPFGATEDATGKLSIAGDAFELHPQPALAIAMGLHELATNAVKYGALSVEGGTVDLSWKLIPGDILQLTWVERGGPVVKKPSRGGFGRRLIERGLAHELGGSARISFNLSGVICEIDIPTATALVARKKRKSDDETSLAERS